MLKSRIIKSSELTAATLRAEDYLPAAKRARLVTELRTNLKTIRAHLGRMEARLKELEALNGED